MISRLRAPAGRGRDAGNGPAAYGRLRGADGRAGGDGGARAAACRGEGCAAPRVRARPGSQRGRMPGTAAGEEWHRGRTAGPAGSKSRPRGIRGAARMRTEGQCTARVQGARTAGPRRARATGRAAGAPRALKGRQLGAASGAFASA